MNSEVKKSACGAYIEDRSTFTPGVPGWVTVPDRLREYVRFNHCEKAADNLEWSEIAEGQFNCLAGQYTALDLRYGGNEDFNDDGRTLVLLNIPDDEDTSNYGEQGPSCEGDISCWIRGHKAKFRRVTPVEALQWAASLMCSAVFTEGSNASKTTNEFGIWHLTRQAIRQLGAEPVPTNTFSGSTWAEEFKRQDSAALEPLQKTA